MIQDFLFLEHEQDIINNWSICVRIKITLIKESKNKNKVVLSLKKIIEYKKQQSEKITHSLLLRTSKVEKVIIVYQYKQFLIKFPWLFQYKELSSIYFFIYTL